jgi:solute:Na+ symporter, SSS family
MSNLSTADLSVLILMLCAFFGIASLKKFNSKITDIVSYMTAGRAITLPLFVVTLVSSWYGSVLGATQMAYKHGIYNFIVMGVFWYIGAVIFALFVADKLRSSKALSLAELTTNIYGKSSGRIVLAMLYIKGLPIPYLMAFSMFVSAIFGVDTYVAIGIATLIAIVLSSKSNLANVIFVDIIQFAIIFVAMLCVVVFSYKSLGGIDYLRASLPETHFQVSSDNTYEKMLLWFLIAVSTTFLSPVFHQRCFAAKTPAIAKRGIFVSIIFWACSDVLTTLGGMYAMAAIGPDVDNAYLVLVERVLPHGVCGFVMASLVITAYSALDSFIFASKSMVVNDLYHGKKLSGAGVFSVGAVTAIITGLLALNFDNDIEKAFITFDCALIGSMLIPTTITLMNRSLLCRKSFNFVVISTFVIACFIQLYEHNESTSLFKILFGNACLTLCVVIIKYAMTKVVTKHKRYKIS